MDALQVTALNVSSVVDHSAVGDDASRSCAVAEEQGVARSQPVAEGVVRLDDVSSDHSGESTLVAPLENIGSSRIGVRQGRRLQSHDGSGLVSLFLAGLGNEQVVIGLLKVEFGNSERGSSILELSSESRDQSVGIVESRVGPLVEILGGGEFSLGLVVDLGGEVEGVPGGIHNHVGLLLLVKSVAEDLLGSGVGVEGEVVDVLGVQGSSESSFGVLGGLAGLGLSVDEDVIGFSEDLRSAVKLFLSIAKVVLCTGNNSESVVYVGSGQLNDLLGSFQNVLGLALSSICSSFIDCCLFSSGLSGSLLGGGHLQGKGGLGAQFSGSSDDTLLICDNLDGGVDSVGGCQLLFLHLVDVILNGDVSVGHFNQVRG